MSNTSSAESRWDKLFAEVKQLVEDGVLGAELCPEPTYWHWPILQPEKLPQKFHEFIDYNEVRL